jgi:mannose-6-phosphate isomerase-like protein (cupin superfamily)
MPLPGSPPSKAIDGETRPVASGTVCQIKAGSKHSLRNIGEDDMIVLTIYDPPRTRAEAAIE